MSIQFNTNTANALINGASIPVPFIHQFVQEAYDTFQYAQKTFISKKDCEAHIQHLENELSVVKEALLVAEEELEESKENARIAQEQRNASNRKIEELQDELYALKEQEGQKKMDEDYDNIGC